jgi:GT2 family glycosyltransferase
VIAPDPAAVWLAADFRMVFEPGTGRDGQVIEVALTDRPVFAGAPPIPGGRRLEEPVMAIAAGSVFVWTGTVMVRRDVFERLRGFDERLPNAEDTHLWLRLAREAPLNVVAGAVAVYRQRPGSVSNADEPPGYWDAVAFRDLYRRPEFRRWRRVLGAAIADRCLMDVRHYRQRGRRGRAFVANGLGLRYAPGSGQLWRAAAGTLLGRD